MGGKTVLPMRLSQAGLEKCRRYHKSTPLTWDEWESLFYVGITSIIPLLAVQEVLRPNAEELEMTKFILFLSVINVFAAIRHARKEFGTTRRQRAAGELQALKNVIELNLEITVFEAMMTSKTFPQNQQPSTSHLRANIMLIGCDEKKLHVVTDYNMNNADLEKELTWDRGRGACGMSWDDNEQISADLTIAPIPNTPDWRHPSEEHKKLTKHILSLVCTPIYRPNTKEIIGILNVDSTEPLSVTRFEAEEMLDKMVKQALMFSTPIYEYLTLSQS